MMKCIKYIVVFLLVFILVDQLSSRFLLVGVNRFYGLNQHSEILLIGHSHLMLASDKKEIESKVKLNNKEIKISKYTREGVSVSDRFEMVRQYLNSPYSDSLKFILYGVDQYSFVKEGLSSNSYKLFYPFMDTKSIDNYIKENAQDKKDYYTHKLFSLTRYSDALINASFRGWLNDFSNYKYGEIDMEVFRKSMKEGKSQFDRKIIIEEDAVHIFEKTMYLIRERNIKVILVNTPIIDLLNEYDPDAHNKVIGYFKNFALSHPNVEYWDFNDKYSSDYTIFYDPIHLNPKGQEIITKEIIKRLNND